MKTLLTTLLLFIAMGANAKQDTPVEIPKGDLPKTAACIVCDASGAAHGPEKPAAGVRYKGKEYYFCNKGEVATFMKEPEAFMPPVLPRPATPLEVTTLDGKKASLVDFKDKVILVDFWATWCKPCVAAMSDLQKLHDKLAPKGFSVVGVSLDEDGAKSVKPFIDKRKFAYPILLDQKEVWKRWGVRSIPAMFLIDKNGQVVRQWVGKVDKKDVEKAVTDLLAR
jgi:peroxiredoxin/YHS domain-containing protein